METEVVTTFTGSYSCRCVLWALTLSSLPTKDMEVVTSLLVLTIATMC